MKGWRLTSDDGEVPRNDEWQVRALITALRTCNVHTSANDFYRRKHAVGPQRFSPDTEVYPAIVFEFVALDGKSFCAVEAEYNTHGSVLLMRYRSNITPSDSYGKIEFASPIMTESTYPGRFTAVGWIGFLFKLRHELDKHTALDVE